MAPMAGASVSSCWSTTPTRATPSRRSARYWSGFWRGRRRSNGQGESGRRLYASRGRPGATLARRPRSGHCGRVELQFAVLHRDARARRMVHAHPAFILPEAIAHVVADGPGVRFMDGLAALLGAADRVLLLHVLLHLVA